MNAAKKLLHHVAKNKTPEGSKQTDTGEERAAGTVVGKSIGTDSELLREIQLKVDLKAAIALIKKGKWVIGISPTLITFVKRRRRVYLRVDMETLAVKWSYETSRRRYKTSRIPLNDVTQVLPGLESNAWKKHKDTERKLGFELITARNQSFKFIVSNNTEYKLWLRGMLHAQAKALLKRKIAGGGEDGLLRSLWVKADVDKSDSMQFPECLALLRSINFAGDQGYAYFLFSTLISDESGVLEFDEFQKFIVTVLSQEDLVLIFSRYQPVSEFNVLSEARFTAFLNETQGAKQAEIDESIEYVRELREPFRITEDRIGKRDVHSLLGHLTVYGFCSFIMNPINTILNLKKLNFDAKTLEEPITNYFIKTVQFPLDSKLTRAPEKQKLKIRLSLLTLALRSGSRCLMVDCMQAEKNRILIKTLEKDGMDLIVFLLHLKDVAFENNPLPIILFFTSSNVDQALLDKRITDTLGPRVYRHAEGRPWPSPTALAAKFIVLHCSSKSGKPSKPPELSAVMEEEFKVLDKIFYCLSSEVFNASDKPLVSSTAAAEKELDISVNRSRIYDTMTSITAMDRRSDATAEEVLPEDLMMTGQRLALNVENPIEEPSRHRRKRNEEILQQSEVDLDEQQLQSSSSSSGSFPLRVVVQRKLALAARQSASSPSVYAFNFADFFQMCKEKKAQLQLVDLTSRQLCLVKTVGSLLFVKTIDPLPFFGFGVQLVPFPASATGAGSLIHHSLFRKNGGCGYVQKPKAAQAEQPVDLFITVIAGRQLPYQSTSFSIEGSKPVMHLSPSICVTLKQAGLTERFVTPPVSNNGLDPRWEGQKFRFEITHPSLSFVLFEVLHFDSIRVTTVAAACIPVDCLKNGIRWVSLVDSYTNMENSCSGLLVEVSFKPAKAKELRFKL